MRRILIAILVVLASPTLHAAGESLRQLEAFRAGGSPLSMGFVQTLRDAAGEVLERQEGRLEILPPNRFRWHYTSPYEAEYGSNGVLVWHWDHELAQVTVRDAAKVVSGTPLALLLDLNAELPVTEESDGWLRWVPAEDAAQFAELRLRMGAKGPLELVLTDFLDQSTRIRFDGIKRPDATVDPRFPSVGPEVLVVDERDQP